MKSPLQLVPVLLGLCVPVLAQSPTPTVKSAEPKLTQSAAQAMINRVLKETSEIRQLPIKRPVPGRVQSSAAVEKMIAGQLQSSDASGETLATQIYLRQLGLVPANFDLKASYAHLLGEQIAGYYSSQTKTFTTTDRVDRLQLETVMAHELTHALQDQSFDLSRLEKWPRHDSDARLAMSSLVEGDATLSMSLYATHSPLRALGVMLSSLKATDPKDAYHSSPRVLRESLIFPYVKGLAFTRQLYARGGWTAVSNAFGQLPQSSQQILHFDLYLARKAPVKIPLRDLSRSLGTNWKLLDHDVNGEMGLALVLGEYISDPSQVERATQGWAGDRYAVYRGPHEAALVVQDVVCNGERDAILWQQAYAKRTSTRFGTSVPVQQRGPLQVWNAGQNGVWMERRGKRVLILEGTVGAFNPASLLRALWK